jgi:DNA-binding beta-propeller fold protein YncE
MAYVYNTAIATSAFPADISDMVLSPDESTIYAVAYYSPASAADTFLVIDTATLTQINSIDLFSVGGHRGARSVAISPDGAAAYVTCQASNQLLAIDTGALTITDTAALAGPNGLAISPDGSVIWVAYSPTSSGIIYKIEASTLNVLSSLISPFRWPPILQPTPNDDTGFGPIVASPDGSAVYVADRFVSFPPFYSRVSVSAIDTATPLVMLGAARGMGELGGVLSALEITPDGSTLYGLSGDTWLYTINIATLSPTHGRTLGLNNSSYALEISNDGSTLFIADYFTSTGNGGLQTMNTSTRVLSDPYPIPFPYIGSLVATNDMSRVFLSGYWGAVAPYEHIAVMDVV